MLHICGNFLRNDTAIHTPKCDYVLIHPYSACIYIYIHISLSLSDMCIYIYIPMSHKSVKGMGGEAVYEGAPCWYLPSVFCYMVPQIDLRNRCGIYLGIYLT